MDINERITDFDGPMLTKAEETSGCEDANHARLDLDRGLISTIEDLLLFVCSTRSVLLIATSLAIMSGCRSKDPQTPEPAEGVLVTSIGSKVDLGAVMPGTRKEKFFWLTNPTSTTVEIENIKVSCDCLKVMLPATKVYGKERIGANIVLDLENEPGTTASMAIEVAAHGRGGKELFSFTVWADIKGEGHGLNASKIQ